jgi:ribonuclease E
MVKQGQELLVQVTKDPFMNKGAMLTTYISLPGRFLVLLPGSDTIGISRKIEDEEERNRLKDIISKLKLPTGFGIIVRTVAGNCTKSILSREVRYLLRLWKNIKKKVNKEKAPALLYKEKELVVRSLRDYFTPDVTEILIDDAPMFHEVKNFINVIASKHTKIVKLYTGDKPIFTKYQLENQIASIFDNRVKLKSGGSIVIEQTEALVSIDVNSGKATQQKSIEKTALQTNLEAVEEISRQLRLRDLGGLIVIDLIDMRDRKHNAEVEKALKTHFKGDKAKIKFGKISKFGLLEISRQRIRRSIVSGSFESCKNCGGKGMVPSSETLGISFLRRLKLETIKPEISSVKGIVPVEIAAFLLNKKRRDIIELELRRNISITIEGDPSMVPGESNVICE